MTAELDILDAFKSALEHVQQPTPPLTLYVNRWQEAAMMASLAAQGLPETLEQLEIEAERIVGPCTIVVIK